MAYDQDAVEAAVAVLQPQINDLQAQIFDLANNTVGGVPLPNEYIIRYPNGDERIFELVEVVPE